MREHAASLHVFRAAMHALEDNYNCEITHSYHWDKITGMDYYMDKESQRSVLAINMLMLNGQTL